MTASDYASAALSDLALGPMLTERARNILTGVVRRAMMEERRQCIEDVRQTRGLTPREADELLNRRPLP